MHWFNLYFSVPGLLFDSFRMFDLVIIVPVAVLQTDLVIFMLSLSSFNSATKGIIHGLSVFAYTILELSLGLNGTRFLGGKVDPVIIIYGSTKVFCAFGQNNGFHC